VEAWDGGGGGVQVYLERQERPTVV
jgi:hypothetical protein